MEIDTINFFIKDSPAAVAIVDKEMNFIGHSNIWLEEFKIKAKNIVGKSYYDVIPDTPKELKEIHEECLKGNSNINKGQKFIHPNGSIQWLKWKINSLKEADGSVKGLIVVAEDITEEKRDEELLLKAKQVARIGGWEVDLVSNKIYWTKITKEIHEVPQDYIPNLEEGINFYKAGADREEITRLLSEAIADGTPWDTELRIITAKGNEIWVRAKGEVEIIGKKCVRIYGTFQDIDEKKKAQLSYQEMSERLRIATESAKIGIWDYNIVTSELIWDDNMYNLYGTNKDDFSGVVEAWEASVHPEDKARSAREVELAIVGEKEFDTEFRIILKNGTIRHIKAKGTVRRDDKGNPLRMIGVNWDITALKKVEHEQKTLLKVTNEQNNSLLNFAHIVSHNLRSHSSNLSMLSGFLGKEENEKEKKNLLKMLSDASLSLEETVQHLNEVVQVKTNASEKMRDVNLYASIKGVEKNLSVLLKDKGVIFDIDIPETLKISAIPAYLDSILLNLFTNSLKYSSPDRDLIIKISSKKLNNIVMVSFSDNGLGIDLSRHRNKLFGMYKTFHRHKDAKGIGLFITKNQIEAMNGSIEVESEVGVGTTFILHFDDQINPSI